MSKNYPSTPNYKRGPLCGVCQLRPRRKSGRYCVECHAAYIREWRKTHPLNVQQRLKASCRRKAGVALQRGQLRRKGCEVCGRPAQMHHDDYDKPLEVRWLCRSDHLALHRAEHGRRG